MKSFQKMRNRHLTLKAEQMIIITSTMNSTLKDIQAMQEGKGITMTSTMLTSAHFQKVPDLLGFLSYTLASSSIKLINTQICGCIFDCLINSYEEKLGMFGVEVMMDNIAYMLYIL